jgi:hypothetical protein
MSGCGYPGSQAAGPSGWVAEPARGGRGLGPSRGGGGRSRPPRTSSPGCEGPNARTSCVTTPTGARGAFLPKVPGKNRPGQWRMGLIYVNTETTGAETTGEIVVSLRPLQPSRPGNRPPSRVDSGSSRGSRRQRIATTGDRDDAGPSTGGLPPHVASCCLPVRSSRHREHAANGTPQANPTKGRRWTSNPGAGDPQRSCALSALGKDTWLLVGTGSCPARRSQPRAQRHAAERHGIDRPIWTVATQRQAHVPLQRRMQGHKRRKGFVK